MATTTTVASGPSNLRTSSRQTRTNPARTSKTVGSTLRQNSLMGAAQIAAVTVNEPHGFYPAITHFTDAIAALPREFRRHASLLKEVDAKAWAPEENLQALLSACVASKPSAPAAGAPQPSADFNNNAARTSAQQVEADSLASVVGDSASQISTLSSSDPTTLRRRRLFYDLRYNLTEIMVTMDEKNHVIHNANEDLSRLLRRLDTVYPQIANEVSEEARFGSLKHWAFLDDKKPAGKSVPQPSRQREAAASLAILHDTDVASRSEARREALLARKQRQNHVDSDFDDAKATSKKVNGNGKSRRIGEITAESNLGLGISTASAPKRRKPEKPAPAVITIERSLSVNQVGGRAMSREPSQQDGGAAKKRKAATSSGLAARKKINTNISATNSPNLASSPLAAVFNKDVLRASPVPANTRPQSSRARQNSTQTHETPRARVPSSASNKNTANGNRTTPSVPEIHNAATAGKSGIEASTQVKEITTNGKIDHTAETEITQQPNGSASEPASIRGGHALEGTASKNGNMKREPEPPEDTVTKALARASPRVPLNSLATEISRTERPSRGRSSKTATPIVGTFAESPDTKADPTTTTNDGNNNKPKHPPHARSSRIKDILHDSLSPTGLPVKRSHKKGAGLAAQAAALKAKQLQAKEIVEEETTAVSSSMADEEDDEEAGNGNGDGDGEEERYCYCQGVSYGEMVACDAKDCPTEWFHLECVGLDKAPGKNTKWYCDECKETLKSRRPGSVGGNGK